MWALSVTLNIQTKKYRSHFQRRDFTNGSKCIHPPERHSDTQIILTNPRSNQGDWYSRCYKKDKESELAYLQENLQKFQQDAQVSIQKKQTDLVNPVYCKSRKAIEEVVLQNGFSYIISPQMVGGGDVLLFTDEKYNILSLLLKSWE